MYLNCHSYFSFKYGTLSVEPLVAEAKKLKLDALALTDINSVSGIFPFIREAQKMGFIRWSVSTFAMAPTLNTLF